MGFLVDGADQATRAVKAAGSLDRAAIRAAPADRFGQASMIRRELDVYWSVLPSHRTSGIYETLR